MSDLSNIENKLDLILQNQKNLEIRMSKLENSIKRIEEDIYIDDDYEFEIICPYCNYEFTVDMDEDKKEVTCPECKNIIELDMTGDLDDECMCGSDGCSGCNGCSIDEEDEEDDM